MGQADTQCFRRDALTRLTTAWTPKTGVTCEPDPTVANLGGPAPYWNSWTHDATGNRLTQVQHTVTGNNTQTSAYPAQGAAAVRPHAVTTVTRSGPAGASVDAYSYDATGNTISRPGVSSAQSLTWNSEGRLASATDASATTSNVYDADGGRLIRRDAAGTTLYLPGMELRREAGTTTCTRYITFAGQTIAQRTNGVISGLTWLYADHQGTGQTAIAAGTQAVTTRRTTPYGTPRGTNPTWPNEKGFVGGDIDPTGLTHLGARAYDPGQGRFISVDPVFVPEDPRQHHGYQYGANDPVTHSDPTGLRLASDGMSGGGPPPASTPEKTKNPKPKKCNWICQKGKQISGAVDATKSWVKENKAEIAGFVVGAVVVVGCAAAIGWTGVGAVACGAIAGAAGAAVTGYMNGERGLDLVTTTIIGAATGAVTSVLGPVAAKAIGGAAKAAAGAITGGGARAAAGTAGTAASAGAKNVAATAGKSLGGKSGTGAKAGPAGDGNSDDALQNYANSLRPGATKRGPHVAAEYTSPSGNTYYGHNGHGMSPQAGGALEKALKNSKHHGQCAEVMCLIQAEAAEGVAGIVGGSFRAVRVRGLASGGNAHGTSIAPCHPRCSTLLGLLKIKVK
ncbi:RHS repeat-associated core domain-containing protein [Polymorphospora sp. NPDC051019]|uniref:RHS repeat-associated core domain-containing protein n=1 Tax=Polymorphospora sp. NPDC051019 TaxID=3155725 RepID=UPI00341CC080